LTTSQSPFIILLFSLINITKTLIVLQNTAFITLYASKMNMQCTVVDIFSKKTSLLVYLLHLLSSTLASCRFKIALPTLDSLQPA